MTAHSKIGASSCYRWWECPGSVNLSRDILPISSPYADEGTAAHEVVEVSLKAWEHPNALLGKMTKVGIEVNEEMVNCAEHMMDEIAQDYFNHFGENPVAKKLQDYLMVEKKFDLSHIHAGLFGTNDACLLIPFTKLYVYDFKYGQGVAVNVENNKQLMYYALGALEGNDDIDEVELVIVQPRAFHSQGPVRRWKVTRAELEAFKAELIIHAEAALSPDAELNAGYWCKFCPALGCCPECKDQAMALAKADFGEAKIPTLPTPEKMTVDQIANVLAKADLLAEWLKGVEAYAQGLLEAGRKVPGFKLVRKRATRKWSDESKVQSVFKHLGQELFEKKLKSPAQLEKLVGKNAVEGMTFIPDTGLTIAPESDKREAAQERDAVADFRRKP